MDKIWTYLFYPYEAEISSFIQELFCEHDYKIKFINIWESLSYTFVCTKCSKLKNGPWFRIADECWINNRIKTPNMLRRIDNSYLDKYLK